MARPSLRLTSVDVDALDDIALVDLYVDEQAHRSLRERAFFLLVNRHQRRLYAVCFRVLGSHSEAEDAVQETFLRLARRAADFRGQSQLSTWLYRIAHNVCTDKLRYNARRPAVAVDDVSSLGADQPAGDEQATHETLAHLHELLGQLDELSRQMLLLIAVDELPYDTVAAHFGLPVGTVKSRVSRARAQLGKLLVDSVGDVAPNAARPTTSHDQPESDARSIRGPP